MYTTADVNKDDSEPMFALAVCQEATAEVYEVEVDLEER